MSVAVAFPCGYAHDRVRRVGRRGRVTRFVGIDVAPGAIESVIAITGAVFACFAVTELNRGRASLAE